MWSEAAVDVDLRVVVTISEFEYIIHQILLDPFSRKRIERELESLRPQNRIED